MKLLTNSLNRNILECKCDIFYSQRQKQIVLIETYWNVNSLMPEPPLMPESVLIETYWNVNAQRRAVACRELSVLIETYWNVNVVQWNKFAKVRGVLIETYWNVNIVGKSIILIAERGLNRNILECKCCWRRCVYACR